MAPLSDPGTRPMVLLTLATTGENPNASKVGKVISDPDPTMVLIVPATRPAPTMARVSSTDMDRVYRSGPGGSTPWVRTPGCHNARRCPTCPDPRTPGRLIGPTPTPGARAPVTRRRSRRPRHHRDIPRHIHGAMRHRDPGH